MKYAILGFAFILVMSVGGVIFWRGLEKDQLYDQKEITNERFRMRILAYREKGVFLPGVYFVFQSASVGSDEWHHIMTVMGDEPISIRDGQLDFVGPQVGYGFIGSYYMVTTNAGGNWSIWNGEKQLPNDEYQKQYNLSAYIEAIKMQPDGTGRMTLRKYFSERERGSDLFTSDYGLSWYFKD